MKKIIKIIYLYFALFAVILIALSGCKSESEDLNALYMSAVRDAAFADEDEVLPLVSLTADDKMTTWDDSGRVLLCTWHSYPGNYPEGENVTVEWGPVWMFTDKEIASYKDELKKCKDPEMRLKQLIGLPPDCDYTTFTGFWVSPDDVMRPAYQTDPESGEMSNVFKESVDEDFKDWFDGNIIASYFDEYYPWTRLGYTYDWADNNTEYGLTEFLVSDKAEITVEFTDTTAEFIKRITE